VLTVYSIIWTGAPRDHVELKRSVEQSDSQSHSNSRTIAMSNVIVVIGAGSIGQAIARRVSAGKHVLLADLRPQNADYA
jgi:phosphoglycerate dehydrogenase-like enzyme